MNIPKSPECKSEFLHDCKILVAEFISEQTDSVNLEKRIMLFHGIAELFPKNSEEHRNAKEAAWAMNTAEKAQLKFKNIISNSNQLEPEKSQ